jgi:hypothetical protein
MKHPRAYLYILTSIVSVCVITYLLSANNANTPSEQPIQDEQVKQASSYVVSNSSTEPYGLLYSNNRISLVDATNTSTVYIEDLLGTMQIPSIDFESGDCSVSTSVQIVSVFADQQQLVLRPYTGCDGFYIQRPYWRVDVPTRTMTYLSNIHEQFPYGFVFGGDSISPDGQTLVNITKSGTSDRCTEASIISFADDTVRSISLLPENESQTTLCLYSAQSSPYGSPNIIWLSDTEIQFDVYAFEADSEGPFQLLETRTISK